MFFPLEGIPEARLFFAYQAVLRKREPPGVVYAGDGFHSQAACHIGEM